MTEKELLEIIEEAAKVGRKELSFFDKHIRSLPPEIGQLTNLVWLYLHDNNIKNPPRQGIDEAGFDLTFIIVKLIG